MDQAPLLPNEEKPSDADTLTPFERFEALTRGLLSVPKTRIDEKLAEEKAEKARTQKPKPAKG